MPRYIYAALLASKLCESGTPEFFRSVVADALEEWFVRRGMPAASHIEGTNLAIAPFPMGAAL
jgi:glutaminase